MGLFKKIFKKVEEEAKKQADKILNPDGDESSSSAPQSQQAKPPSFDPANPPTRWEKAVVALNGVVAQVAKVDHDGVDLICFPGSGDDTEGGSDYDIYRNVRDATGIEEMVNARPPGGLCEMGKAMDVVLAEAFARGFAEKPTAVLVLTAGRPDDHEDLSRTLADAAGRVEKDADLTVTFVQVGDDAWAESYLSHLDTELVTTNAEGEEIDIVDTIKDEEIQAMMNEVQEDEGKAGSGTAGALFGAFAGAALGAGGVFLANQMQAKKRTEGWNGTWKLTSDHDGTGEEVAQLQVKDDLDGNLEITGWPNAEDKVCLGSYADNGEEGGFNIQHCTPELVVGTVEDEHTIRWDDGSRWEEIPPPGASWTAFAAGAAGGAATAGAAGYLLDKKFFHKASEGVPSDYVIVLDRSRMMGRNPPRGPPPPKATPTPSAASSPMSSSDQGGTTGLSNKDAKYEDVRWSKMPVGARNAAKVLGFDGESWDEGIHTEIEGYKWGDLEDDQRRAARTLGWTEGAWDNRYEEHGWEDLPGPVKRAAEQLGFDADGEMWDGDEWPEVHEKSWDEMTEEERRALHVLGYWQNNWKVEY